MTPFAGLAGPGSLDGTFNVGTGPQNTVAYFSTSLTSLAISPDDRILIGGDFTDFAGLPRRGLVRLNPDGSPDATFDPGPQFNLPVRALARQPDGKLLIGGPIGSHYWPSSIARLNPDGTLDPIFHLDQADLTGTIEAIVPEEDGRVLIGGFFDLREGHRVAARLLPDGKWDPTFVAPSNLYQASCLVRQPDSKWLVGGLITFCRLNADGSLDPSFQPALPSDTNVRALAFAAGKILVGGYNNGTRTPLLARLNPDGSLDPSFAHHTDTTLQGFVMALAVPPDGKCVVAGDFTEWNGVAVRHLVRLHPDGTPDLTFQPGADPDAILQFLSQQTDGRFIVAGQFSTFDGVGRRQVARLLTDGMPNPGILEFAEPAPDVAETEGTGTVTLKRSAGSAGTVSITVAVGGGTATPGTDFALAATQVTFGDGVTSQTVPVTLTDDPDYEGDESVQLVLSAPTGGASLGPVRTTLLTIRDNESGFQFSQATYRVNEVMAEARLTLTRGGDVGLPATVDFAAVADSAAADVDFVPVEGTLAFDAGVVSQSFAVPLRDNATRDAAPRTVRLNLSNPTGNTVLGTPATAQLEILDNDRVGGVDATFSQADPQARPVQAIALAEDGRVVVGGAFVLRHPDQPGDTRVALATLEPDGTLDPRYRTQLGYGTYPPPWPNPTRVRSLQRLADGGVLAAGELLASGYEASGGLRRLTAAGEFVSHYRGPMPDLRIGSALVTDAEGQSLVAGWFGPDPLTSVMRVVRVTADGTLDPGFNSNLVANAEIRVLARQADGRFLVGGAFSEIAGQPHRALARFEPDGTFDPTFDPGTAAEGTVLVVAIQPDGRLLVGGDFASYNGLPAQRLVRLEPDGALDPGLDSTAVDDGEVRSIALAPDGKIFLGGTFTRVAGTSRNGIARLTANGTLDADFDPGTGADGPVNSIAVQPDGQVLLGGDFTEIDGAARVGSARLNGDGLGGQSFIFFARSRSNAHEPQPQTTVRVRRAGALDQEVRVDCVPAGGTASARADYSATPATLVFQPGQTEAAFTLDTHDDAETEGTETLRLELRNASAPCLLTRAATDLRILDNETPGTVDPRFRSPLSDASGTVRTLVRQPDGKILVGGYFDTQPRAVFRLNADGTLDPTFDPGADSARLTNRCVFALALQPDGKILIAGGGSLPPITGAAGTNHLVRLHPNGSLDTSFKATWQLKSADPSAVLLSVALLPNGQILIGSSSPIMQGVWDTASTRYLARLSDTGALDLSFPKPMSLPEVCPRALVLQPDGSIIAGGYRTSGWSPIPNLMRLNAQGELDASFATWTDRGTVRALALQPDGLLIVGMEVVNPYTAQPSSRLVRLLPNGRHDATFLADVNGNVNAILQLPDGKLLIGGEFTAVNQTPRARLARLHPDGSLDPAFDPGGGPDEAVAALVLGWDNKPLVGGAFANVDGSASLRLARFLGGDPGPESPGVIEFDAAHFQVGEGAIATVRVRRTQGSHGAVSAEFATADATATAPADYTPTVERVEFADGEVGIKSVTVTTRPDDLLEGHQTVNLQLRDPAGGVALVEPSHAVLVIEDAAQGQFNPAFDAGAFDQPVLTTAAQADGRLLAGGWFTSVAGQNRNLLARFQPDGSLDDTFAPAFTGSVVWSVAVLTDQKILAGGQFRQVSGIGRTNLVRLHPDGRVDLDYVPRGFGTQTTGRVAPLYDGRAFIAGAYGQSGRLYRLGPNGVAETAFPALWRNVYAITPLPDGKVLIGGAFTTKRPGVFCLARLHPDGTEDLSFLASASNSPGATSTDAEVLDLALQADGRILVGGEFKYINGVKRVRLARLHPDGSLDASFQPEAVLSSSVKTLTPTATGVILIGGWIESVGGKPRPLLAALNLDGSLSGNYHLNLMGTFVHSLTPMPDGSVLLGGQFALPTPTGARLNLLRLQGVPNAAPAVTIDSPARHAEFIAGDPIPLRATAIDPDGWVERVEFWSGATLLGTTSVEPYTLIWSDAAAGEYSLSAVAVDACGLPGIAPGVPITVTEPVPPQFTGTISFTADAVLLEVQATPGRRYELQSSVDLVEWVPLTRERATAPTLILMDRQSAQYPHRFYRVVDLGP